ncbi:MAG: PDDEXK nuclease domain-containing protein [Elusimicrobiota bacterium]|nr:PDDEXK nuclease domain-containing protein [Elusimicrobiota bacterium]
MNTNDYAQLLDAVKARVRAARLRAAVAVNSELVMLYWHIGRDILQRQAAQGWGTKVIGRLSRDLMCEFPDMRGFAPRNLQFMRAFAHAYQEEPIVKQLVSQIPWGHNIVLLGRVKNAEERKWYAREVIKHGWKRDILVHQLKSGLYERQGKAVTNFPRTLSPEQSDLAREILKDPYDLEFLGLTGDADERVVESGIVARIQRFLLELGVGFAFIGRQARLVVGGVELKASAFKPEHAGKMNFYLAAVDDLMRQAEDRPSIGMILCRSKNRVVVEYSLHATGKPIWVAAYTLEKELPRELRGALPAPEDLERVLRDESSNT